MDKEIIYVVCPKCGRTFKSEENFCDQCVGVKLNKFTRHEFAEKYKECEKVVLEAADFITSLKKDFICEELTDISYLINEMRDSLRTLNPDGVRVLMNNLKIIGENRDSEMMENE